MCTISQHPGVGEHAEDVALGRVDADVRPAGTQDAAPHIASAGVQPRPALSPPPRLRLPRGGRHAVPVGRRAIAGGARAVKNHRFGVGRSDGSFSFARLLLIPERRAGCRSR